jgi:hypothetical protein
MKPNLRTSTVDKVGVGYFSRSERTTKVIPESVTHFGYVMSDTGPLGMRPLRHTI